MEKQKFITPNKLAEEALLELRQRITEVNLTEIDIENKKKYYKSFRLKANPTGVKNQ